MRPSFIIVLLLSITSFSSAAMLFLDGSQKTSPRRNVPTSSVEIKWGEGSEAGAPASITHK